MMIEADDTDAADEFASELLGPKQSTADAGGTEISVGRRGAAWAIDDGFLLLGRETDLAAMLATGGDARLADAERARRFSMSSPTTASPTPTSPPTGARALFGPRGVRAARHLHRLGRDRRGGRIDQRRRLRLRPRGPQRPRSGTGGGLARLLRGAAVVRAGADRRHRRRRRSPTSVSATRRRDRRLAARSGADELAGAGGRLPGRLEAAREGGRDRPRRGAAAAARLRGGALGPAGRGRAGVRPLPAWRPTPRPRT